MTLIALTVNNVFEGQAGYPVLMGDILFSSEYFTGNLPTPTYAQGTNHLYGDNSKYYPIDLNQKLYVINDRLCVALGGKLSQMDTFLKRLKAFYSSVDFDDDDLWKFVGEFGQDEGTGICAIVLKCSKDGGGFQLTTIGLGSANRIQSQLYGTVLASGSGAETFLNFIKSEPKFGTDINNTDAFLSSNLSIIAHFLGMEVSNGETLTEAWGAGFEMIIFENGKFIKLPQYAVVIIDAPFGRDIIFEARPRLAMLINYEKDVMIIKAVSDTGEWNFAIPSIIEEETIITVKDVIPGKGALLMSYIFRYVDKGDKKYYSSTVHPRNVYRDGKSPILFERDESGKFLILKDQAQDIFVLQKVLEAHGFKVDLKEVP